MDKKSGVYKQIDVNFINTLTEIVKKNFDDAKIELKYICCSLINYRKVSSLINTGSLLIFLFLKTKLTSEIKKETARNIIIFLQQLCTNNLHYKLTISMITIKINFIKMIFDDHRSSSIALLQSALKARLKLRGR